LEGIAFEVRDVVDLMAEDGSVTLHRLNVDGGAAANDLLCQTQANTLGISVDRPVELQTTGVGAAFLAGLGTGVWSTPEEIAACRSLDRSFTPAQDAKQGADMAHRRWREAVSRSRDWAAPN